MRRQRRRTSANCGVRPMPPRSISTSTVAADLRRRDSARSAAVALVAQPRRALLDDGARRPAACARPACPGAARTETRAGRSGRSRRRGRSELANMSSVSVGKPAIRSAPNTMSGRSRRTSAQNADRVGAQVPPLHALQDHVVAGLQRQMQMRHQPRLLGDARASAARRPRPDRSTTGAGASAPARASGSAARARRASACRADRRRTR